MAANPFKLETITQQRALKLADSGDHLIAAEDGSRTKASVWRTPTIPHQELYAILGTYDFGEVHLTYARKGSNTSIVFKTNGDDTPKWIIATSLFNGNPKLSLAKISDTEYRLKLKDARFPGTNLPADFEATIVWKAIHNELKWMMRLSFDWGGFDTELVLQEWLEGHASAHSSMLFEGEVCPVSESGNISIAAFSDALFFPSWMFRLHKKQGIPFTGAGEAVTFNTLFLTLLSPDMPSVIPNHPDRRSLFLLLRQNEGPFTFPLWPDQEATQGWLFSGGEPPFQTFALETAETLDDVVTRALVVSGNATSRIGFMPGADLIGSLGNPLAIELTAPIYGAIYDGFGKLQNAGLFAGIADVPRWVHTKVASLLLTLTQRKLFALLQIGNRYFMGHPQELLTPYQGQKYRLTGLHFNLAQVAARPGEVVAVPVTCNGTRVFLTFKSRPVPLAGNQGEILVTPGIPEADITLPLTPDISCLRPDNLMYLRFRFIGMRLKTRGAQARLVRQGTAPARMVVVFPPQSIGEQSFLESENPANNEKVTIPAQSRLAGQSRLAFTMENEIPFVLEHLLDWSAANPALQGPHLAPTALSAVSANSDIKRPEADETAIEAPFRLVISPDETGTWSKERTEDSRSRVELWHKRLEKHGGTPLIRAIWTLDPAFDPNAAHEPPVIDPNAPVPYNGADYDPFKLSSLSCRDRGYIVTNSVRDEAVEANRLMLTSLGSWLELSKFWNNPDLALERWDHRMTLGRDQYVKVISRGYLGTTGHRAVVIAITERKVEEYGVYGLRIAPLRTRFFIVVREPVRTYPFPAESVTIGNPATVPGRSMPFATITILDKTTPILDLPENSELLPGAGKEAFWPRAGGEDFRFRLVSRDSSGNEHHFTAPLFFVRSFDKNNETQSQYHQFIAQALNEACNTDNIDNDLANPVADPVSMNRHTYVLQGQNVAFAQKTAGTREDTSFEANTITFRAVQYKYPGDPDPRRPFNPMVHEASVFVPSLRHFGGIAAPVRVRYFSTYLKDGFETPNTGGVFLRFITGVDMLFGQGSRADKVGGLITPSLTSTGLSRSLGVVGSQAPAAALDNDSHLDTIAQGTFKPEDYFGTALQAKILGGIVLTDLLDAGPLANAPAPQWISGQSGGVMTHSLSWSTGHFREHDYFKRRFDDSDPPKSLTRLTITVTITQKNDASTGSDTIIDGNLEFFAIEFAGIFKVAFNQVRFLSGSGLKPDLDVSVDHVEFLGALQFLTTLVDCLQTGQFSDPPSVDVGVDGVTVGYSLGIPSVALGAFAFQNLALSASLCLPFTGQAMRVRFALSERHNPFLVTISLFTGGGFFAVALGPDCVEIVEAAIEFGGSFTLNLGVASGGVYLMAGIYFKIEQDIVALTGYVRAGGCVEVLGLISVSIEFYLGLTYTSSNTARGEASVEVEVEVLFFSTSVTLTVEREYSAGSRDIPFDVMMPENDWDVYWGAFVVEE